MSKYAIAWTEFFENNIAVEFYEADSAFEAAKECWKKHFMLTIDGGVDRYAETKLNNFTSVEDIKRDFFDCDENISEPVLVENLTKNNKCSMEFC